MEITKEIPVEHRPQYRRAFMKATGCLKPEFNRPIGEEGGHYSVAKLDRKPVAVQLPGIPETTLEEEVLTSEMLKGAPPENVEKHKQRSWWGYGKFAGIDAVFELGYQIEGDPRNERNADEAKWFAAINYTSDDAPRRMVAKFDPYGRIHTLAYSAYYNDGSNLYDKMEVRPDEYVRLQQHRRDRGDEIKADNLEIQFEYNVYPEKDQFVLQREWQGENLFSKEFTWDSASDAYKGITHLPDGRSIFHGASDVTISKTGGSMTRQDSGVHWEIRPDERLTGTQLWEGNTQEKQDSPELYAENFGKMLTYLERIEPLVHLSHSKEAGESVAIGLPSPPKDMAERVALQRATHNPRIDR